MEVEIVEIGLAEKIAYKVSFETSRAAFYGFSFGAVANVVVADTPWYWKIAGLATGGLGVVASAVYWGYWNEITRGKGINIAKWPTKGWEEPNIRFIKPFEARRKAEKEDYLEDLNFWKRSFTGK